MFSDKSSVKPAQRIDVALTVAPVTMQHTCVVELTGGALDPRIDQLIHLVQQVLQAVQQAKEAVMADLNSLTLQVERVESVGESAVTLLNGLADLLRQSASDPAAINALAARLSAESDNIAAAVTANTPAA